MQASVTASALNIRSAPNISARVLGVLMEDTIVEVVDNDDYWLEVRYQSLRGFVFRDYVEMQDIRKKLYGVVTASLLNVRQEPSLTSRVIGRLIEASRFKINSQFEDWLEIQFNDAIGYVSRSFVDVIPIKPSYKASVITSILNVRAFPGLKSPVIGQLIADNVVEVFSTRQNWAEIKLNGQSAFVYLDFIKKLDQDDAGDIFTKFDDLDTGDEEDNDYVLHAANILDVEEKLEPNSKLPVAGSATEKKVSRAWNQYGGLLERLSKSNQLDVACSVAVLCVESSGRGFDQNNENRMIIRFENHKFWKFWGKKNPETFRKYFTYRSDKVWLGHQWRFSESEPWSKFHGRQSKEWEVFEFARSLDSDAAMLSISMGAPQIMGFHFQRLGYESVAEMFIKFNSEIESQIEGLFNFFSQSMIEDLRNQDFIGFAAAYNGSGQKHKYGNWIDEHFSAFKKLV